jgi:Zn-dependent protease
MTIEAQAPKATPDRSVSVIFLLLVLAFSLIGIGLVDNYFGRIGVFVFVMIGWVISLCLHEWGHAITAHLGGDNNIAERGYLTLNPVRYANPVMSIVIPLLFLAMGGIGFPGGAVYVRNDLLRGPLWRMAVSAAGPGMNLVCLIVLGICYRFGGFIGHESLLGDALALLALLQATALLLNLLPVPGLDGFGILRAILPPSVINAIAPFSNMVFMAFFVIMMGAPQFIQPLWDAAFMLCSLFGIGPYIVHEGFALFRFWEPVF